MYVLEFTTVLGNYYFLNRPVTCFKIKIDQSEIVGGQMNSTVHNQIKSTISSKTIVSVGFIIMNERVDVH